MKRFNMILTKKLQNYFILSFSDIDKYEYLRGEEILPIWQGRIIEQTKFNCSPFRKIFEKKKNDWRSRIKLKLWKY